VLRPRAARRLPLSMDLPCWRCERCAHALGARLRRHLFTPEARDRGYPADDPVHSFGTPEELRSEGFIVNDSVRISASVRVYPGKRQCSADHVAHPLLRRDGLCGHVAHAFGECSFYCDICVVTLPSSQLHCCAAGCNFDVCSDCVEAARCADNAPQISDPLRRARLPTGIRLV